MTLKLLPLLFLCSCSHLLPSPALKPAQSVVEAFCKNDAAGHQAWSSHWKDKIQPLTQWEEVPKWDVAQIVSEYKIVDSVKNNGLIEITVLYKILGQLESAKKGFKFLAFPESKQVTYFLSLTDGEWKIISPQLEPHISIETAYKLLDRKQINGIKMDYKVQGRHLLIRQKIQSL